MGDLNYASCIVFELRVETKSGVGEEKGGRDIDALPF